MPGFYYQHGAADEDMSMTDGMVQGRNIQTLGLYRQRHDDKIPGIYFKYYYYIFLPNVFASPELFKMPEEA